MSRLIRMPRVSVVPEGTSVPLDSEAGRSYLQERLQLLSKLYLVLAGFFFVAGGIHRTTFLSHGGFSGWFTVSSAIHLLVMVLFLGTFLVTRRARKVGAVALMLLDAGLALGTMSGCAVQVRLASFLSGHRVEQVALLVSFAVLVSRAVIVPSAPRVTFAVSSVATIPAMLVAMWMGRARGAVFEALSFSAMWCCTIIGLTTFTSRVIYGLREKVVKARQLGQYALERKIGEGGMGEVYLARHTMLRRPTAVKLLPPERAGAETIARFEREVRETSRLSHPNTVAIYDYGRTPTGVFYYAMEYLEGLDLQRLVERGGPLPASRVVHILAQIAGALGEAHARGLVHRDVKPANVVLCDRGGVKDTVKVLDFGLVKHVEGGSADPRHTDVNALVGTPTYMSPEAIRSADLIDARSDLYAVGAIGYYLLTGRHVFGASSVIEMCAAHLHEAPVAPSVRLRGEVPADLEALVLRCLAKEPSKRPGSAHELRRELLACDVGSWSEIEAELWWETYAPDVANEGEERGPVDTSAPTLDAVLSTRKSGILREARIAS